MPNKNNVAMLEKVSESLDSSKGVFVIDYRGLSVKETQGLRRALTEAGAHMKVYKNNLQMWDHQSMRMRFISYNPVFI